MTNDTTKCAADGGCTPVKELHKEIIDNPKVSWPMMIVIMASFLSLMGIVAGGLYAETKQNQKDIKELAISDAELRLAYKNTEDNTKQILEILIKQNQDKEAEKIASKELKAYNTPKTN